MTDLTTYGALRRELDQAASRLRRTTAVYRRASNLSVFEPLTTNTQSPWTDLVAAIAAHDAAKKALHYHQELHLEYQYLF